MILRGPIIVNKPTPLPPPYPLSFNSIPMRTPSSLILYQNILPHSLEYANLHSKVLPKFRWWVNRILREVLPYPPGRLPYVKGDPCFLPLHGYFSTSPLIIVLNNAGPHATLTDKIVTPPSSASVVISLRCRLRRSRLAPIHSYRTFFSSPAAIF